MSLMTEMVSSLLAVMVPVAVELLTAVTLLLEAPLKVVNDPPM